MLFKKTLKWLFLDENGFLGLSFLGFLVGGLAGFTIICLPLIWILIFRARFLWMGFSIWLLILNWLMKHRAS